jgi:hypothetical protein
VQKELLAGLRLALRAFAKTRDWSAPAGFLTHRHAFGAAHALTLPGSASLSPIVLDLAPNIRIWWRMVRILPVPS